MADNMADVGTEATTAELARGNRLLEVAEAFRSVR